MSYRPSTASITGPSSLRPCLSERSVTVYVDEKRLRTPWLVKEDRCGPCTTRTVSSLEITFLNWPGNFAPGEELAFGAPSGNSSPAARGRPSSPPIPDATCVDLEPSTGFMSIPPSTVTYARRPATGGPSRSTAPAGATKLCHVDSRVPSSEISRSQPVTAATASALNKNSAPPNITSIAAAEWPLPTRRLPMSSASGSIAPLTGTP